MNGAWAVAGCLATGAVVMAWPYGGGRRRLAGRPLRLLRAQPIPAWLRPVVIRVALTSAAERHPRRLIAGSSAAAALVCLLVGGLVAALVGAVYMALAVRAVTRRIAVRRAAADRGRSLDELSSLAADLRAGLPPASATSLVSVPTGPSEGEQAGRGRIAELTAAVWRLAEQTGAPAADLVERVEADARAADRARASAAAEAAGAQATALLLAALPVGGIALGYAIGADPLRVLLHTPIGAVCAVASVLLQCAGLLWADRLASGPAR